MTWAFFFIKKKKKKRIKVVDTIDGGNEFDCLRPKFNLILKIDSIDNLPTTGFLFDDWYANSVSLLPNTSKAGKHFL